MLSTTTPESRHRLLSFASSFAWADLDIDRRERRLVADLARELGSHAPEDDAEAYLAAPPDPATIDPRAVPRELAPLVRQVALRAIASDGKVTDAEMDMFFLLDALLPGDDGGG